MLSDKCRSIVKLTKIGLVSALHPSAIHCYGCACDVTGALRSQKCHYAGEFFRLSEAPQRNLAGPALLDLLDCHTATLCQLSREPGQSLSARVSRTDIIHQHVVRTVFVRQALHQAADG